MRWYVKHESIHLLPNVKISRSIQDETNLLIRVQMLSKEWFQFIVIVRQALFGTRYLFEQKNKVMHLYVKSCL